MSISAQKPTIFGGNTGMTYEDVQRKRKMVEQLMGGMGKAPKNVGEGLHAIGNALLARSMEKKADKRDAELREQFNTQFRQAAPNQQGLVDLANSPYAGKGHQNVISALMKGAPNFANGGRMRRKGKAVVGEFGPEVVDLPEGATVEPMVDPPVNPDDMLMNEHEISQEEMLLGGEGADRLGGVYEQPNVSGDKVTNRAVVQKELGQRNALNGLSSVMEELQANPDLLDSTHTMTGRAKTAMLRLRDRLGVEAWDIGPEGEKALGDTTAYKQELLTQVNNYIKEITGATVGQGDETKRLMAVQANESDSPTQVISKITNAMNLARMEIARQKFMQREGGDAPSDTELRGILKDRGKALYESAVAGGLSPDEARMQAAAALSEEFGL